MKDKYVHMENIIQNNALIYVCRVFVDIVIYILLYKIYYILHFIYNLNLDFHIFTNTKL